MYRLQQQNNRLKVQFTLIECMLESHTLGALLILVSLLLSICILNFSRALALTF